MRELPVDFDGHGVAWALGISSLLTVGYLGALYVLPQPRDRNHPRAIIARMIGATAAAVGSPLVLHLCYGVPAGTGVLDAIWLTNTAPATATAAALPAAAAAARALSSHSPAGFSAWVAHHGPAAMRSLAVFALLFAGPLVQLGLDCLQRRRLARLRRRLADSNGAQGAASQAEHLYAYGGSLEDSAHVSQGFGARMRHWLMVLRNVVVAPITEEVVFRGCITAIMLPHMSPAACNLLCPLIFGVAHIHHLVRGVPFGVVVLQLVYTSIFGSLASLVLLRTQSLHAAIVAHMFCNAMGLPDFEGALEHHRKRLVVSAYVVGLLAFTILLSARTII